MREGNGGRWTSRRRWTRGGRNRSNGEIKTVAGKPEIEPFAIHVEDAVLEDLKERLRRTRFPNPMKDTGWEVGTPVAYMKELVDYWLNEYDWRKWEAELNRFDHFRTNVGSERIHFIHEKGSGPNPMPLILSHGWPGSVFEFSQMIEPLAHPERFGGKVEDAFDVVVPSLPGYGFSSMPQKPTGPRATAALWNELMTENLGYKKYAAQGGDWGAFITGWLGFNHGENVLGIHLNRIGPDTGPDVSDPPLSDEEKNWIEGVRKTRIDVAAYSHQHTTRPQSLAYGLNDSPAGLAAWIVEKYYAWSDIGGDLESVYTKDQLLTAVTIYWVTGTIHSSIWFYRAVQLAGDRRLPAGRRVEVPTGFAFFPVDLQPQPPRSWWERAYNLTRWTDMKKGGHFAALEQPEALTRDIRAFFRGLRG
ncbi:MAG: epoxide hydrolase [Alphaproteobacteria bacterium]|nr:epoxide hydrolase [Alphaproteobacteria bacterium]